MHPPFVFSPRYAASMKVSQIVWDKEEYKVMEHYSIFGEDNKQKQEPQQKVSKQITHIVYPDKKNCTFGK